MLWPLLRERRRIVLCVLTLRKPRRRSLKLVLAPSCLGTATRDTWYGGAGQASDEPPGRDDSRELPVGGL